MFAGYNVWWIREVCRIQGQKIPQHPKWLQALRRSTWLLSSIWLMVDLFYKKQITLRFSLIRIIIHACLKRKDLLNSNLSINSLVPVLLLIWFRGIVFIVFDIQVFFKLILDFIVTDVPIHFRHARLVGRVNNISVFWIFYLDFIIFTIIQIYRKFQSYEMSILQWKRRE